MTDLVGKALVDPNSRRPSIETLLHAFLPSKHIDHVHADAICALTNHPAGKKAVAEALGDDFAYVNWIRPGFELSKYYNLSTGSEDYIKTLVPAVYSSRFTFDGDTCTLQDNGSGELYIYRTGSSEQDITAIRKIGTVDYTVGSITINSFNISDYVGNGIHIHVNPVSKDIASNRNTILTINDSDVEVFVVAIKE